MFDAAIFSDVLLYDLLPFQEFFFRYMTIKIEHQSPKIALDFLVMYTC